MPPGKNPGALLERISPQDNDDEVSAPPSSADAPRIAEDDFDLSSASLRAPPLATSAHDWSHSELRAEGAHFCDQHGRVCLMRGVNVSGCSKLPATAGPYFEHRSVSFCGRPFPLDEADLHFSRLRAWGLTFVRLLVPWEALEHAGPGEYDDEYIGYLEQLIARMPAYGLQCVIDPHQDCWSRFSGGSGAPGWTFEVAGLDMRAFEATGAATAESLRTGGRSAPMVWPTNYTKLAASTMFTLFFAGATFAPELRHGGTSVQEFLQGHFVRCFARLARRLARLPAVVGFEVLNEPHPGFIGLPCLERGWDANKNLMLGACPTPLEAFALGSGIPTPVGVWERSWPWPTRRRRTILLNTGRRTAWTAGRCVWREHGVWDVANGKPTLLKRDYFATNPRTGAAVSFENDFYRPFLLRYAAQVRAAAAADRPGLLILFEPVPQSDPCELRPPKVEKTADDELLRHLVYAPHWYDLKTLFTKSFDGWLTHDVAALSSGTYNVLAATFIGMAGANRNYRRQIRNLILRGLERVGPLPVLIGECGLPMDMNDKQAFETGDFGLQTRHLDAVLNAFEHCMVPFTLWNYNPLNDHDNGDHWNGEDFSIYSTSAAHSRRTTSTSLAGATGVARGPRALVDRVASALRRRAPSGRSEALPVEAKVQSPGRASFDLDPHHAGGRALDAAVRPYAAKVPGTPLLTRFSLHDLSFDLVFVSGAPVPQRGTAALQMRTLAAVERPDGGDARLARVCEVFLPNWHYGDFVVGGNLKDPRIDVLVSVSDGDWEYNRESQTLCWWYDDDADGESADPQFARHDVAAWFGHVSHGPGRAALGAFHAVLHRLGMLYLFLDSLSGVCALPWRALVFVLALAWEWVRTLLHFAGFDHDLVLSMLGLSSFPGPVPFSSLSFLPAYQAPVDGRRHTLRLSLTASGRHKRSARAL